MGPTCELPDGRVLKRLKDLRTRPYQSVFAEFEVERYVYATREGQKIEFVSLDTRLGLPESKFSFLLQDFDQNLAMEQPFGQVTSTIARILNVAQHVDSVKRVEILDLLHVTPRLWDAARVFCTSDAQAEQFVRERVTKVLHGDVQGVVRGLRQMASRRGIKGKARAKLERICGYLEKNRHRMHYDEYLAAGYPIASGVIEGACRHIVKDRMERTGMNWIIEGAQPMLDLRCVFLSEQWDEFMQFYITTQIKNTHPYRQMIDNLPWQIAV